MVNCVANVTRDCLPCFYIFKGEQIGDDHIKLCKVGTCNANQGMDDIFPLQIFLSFFKELVLGENFQSNRHLLIIDGHGSHVMLETIVQAQEFGLDMVTLPTHTSHALQTLDVSCLKPFKTTFKKERDNAMVNNNHCELDKCILVSWVKKNLD